jgi:hypothetical protein
MGGEQVEQLDDETACELALHLGALMGGSPVGLSIRQSIRLAK